MAPDPNIEHRRIPNQITFMSRHALSLPLGSTDNDRTTWLPGDIVYRRFPDGSEHCGIVTDCIGRSGLPMVIHNAGISREKDVLARWRITGHFRFPRPGGE